MRYPQLRRGGVSNNNMATVTKRQPEKAVSPPLRHSLVSQQYPCINRNRATAVLAMSGIATAPTSVRHQPVKL